MKTKSSSILALVALVAAVLPSTISTAGESPKPYTGSAEFEKLKALAGSWQGETDMGKGPMPVAVQYRVISNGSAVEERLFADTPMEMITIYHEEGGKPALTHYCMLCNRPAMTMVKSDANSLTFDLAKNSGLDAATEKHMHSVAFTFDDADHFTQDWTLYDGGKEQPHHAFKLERVKK